MSTILYQASLRNRRYCTRGQTNRETESGTKALCQTQSVINPLASLGIVLKGAFNIDATQNGEADGEGGVSVMNHT